MPPVDWYLEVNGSKTGPYPSDQILGLFHEGEIPPEARITADHLHDQWITVQELARSAHQIPERPDFSLLPQSSHPTASENTSEELFDTVQRVRHPTPRSQTKPSAKATPTPAKGAPSAEPSPSELPESRDPIDWKKWGPRAGLALLLIALVSFSFWGILQLMKSDAKTSAPPPPQANGGFTPDFKPAAPGRMGNRFGGSQDEVPAPTSDNSQPEMGARLPRPPQATPTRHTDPLEVFQRPAEPQREEPQPVNEPPNDPPPPAEPPPPPVENENRGDGAT